MDYFSATIYGIVQGLCEFLPISSSGHLAILPRVLHVQDPGVFFDLLMHVGTGLAVSIYYRNEIIHLIRSFVSLIISVCRRRRWIPSNHYDFLMINMTLATVSSVILIALLKKHSEVVNRNIILIGFNLIIFGFLMWILDLLIKSKVDHELEKKVDLKSSIMIGIAQALAIFPGVSRAGITLTMGRGLGFSKSSSANFSFLLSLPLIFAGALSKGVEVLKTHQPTPDIVLTLYAILLSGVVGLMTIHFFLKLIKNINLIYFFLYRLIIGIILWNMI